MAASMHAQSYSIAATLQLLVAAQAGDLLSMRHAIDNNARTTSPAPFDDDPDAMLDASPLAQASIKGSVDAVDMLLDHGAHPDACPAFLAATQHGRVAVMERLLERGVLLQEVESKAVPLAALYGSTEALRCLIKHGADPLQDNGNAIHIAITRGYTDVTQLLLAHLSSDDPRCPDTGSLLVEAAVQGQERIVRVLLSHGVDVHHDSDSALRQAAYQNVPDVVRLLLTAGADIAAEGHQALAMASFCGHIEMVRLLLEHGADVRASDYGALRAAASAGFADVVALLLAHGADAHALDDDALFQSVKHDHPHVASVLLTHGAHVTPAVRQCITGAPSTSAAQVVASYLVRQKLEWSFSAGFGDASAKPASSSARPRHRSHVL